MERLQVPPVSLHSSSHSSSDSDIESGAIELEHGPATTVHELINNLHDVDPTETAILDRLKKQWSERKHLHPTSQIRRHWNRWLGFFTVWNIITIPIRIAFSSKLGFTNTPLEHPFFYFLDYLGDLGFILDIVLNHYSYYFHQGILVKEHQLIVKRYHGFWFWVDLVSTVPIDIFIWMNPIWHFYARLPRFMRIFRLFNYFYLWESYSSYPNIFRIIKLFLTFFVLSNWVACLFYTIYVVEDYPETDWFLFNRNELDPNSSAQVTVISAYSRSLYWSVTMMTGQGSDPQTPRTDLEVWFALACVVLGLVLLATAISEIWTLLKTMNEQKELINKKKDRMNSLMQDRKLPRTLRKRVWDYFEYIQSSNVGMYEDEEILKELPYHLSSEIYMYLNREIIMNVPLFNKCPPMFIRTLSTRLRPVFFGPDDSIVTYGEIGREMYFISQGKVKAVTAQGDLIRTMGKGDFFGEVALMSSHSKRTASIIALEYVTVYMLTAEDFQDVLKDYPIIKKKISKMSKKRTGESAKTKPKKSKTTPTPEIVIDSTFSPIPAPAILLQNMSGSASRESSPTHTPTNTLLIPPIGLGIAAASIHRLRQSPPTTPRGPAENVHLSPEQ